MITVENLKASAGEGREILSGVSFSLKGGESMALLGGNGAGKSTLFKVLLGLFPSSGGEADIFSIRLEKKNFPKIREAVGMGFQNPDEQLFNPNVLDDISFGPKSSGFKDAQARQMAREIAERLGIGHLLDRSPQSLSEGEKKLAAIAGVLVMNPKALFLDEPDASLDPRTRRQLADILNSITCPKIIATHDLAFAEKTCSIACLLKNGASIKTAGINELISESSLLAECGLA